MTEWEGGSYLVSIELPSYSRTSFAQPFPESLGSFQRDRWIALVAAWVPGYLAQLPIAWIPGLLVAAWVPRYLAQLPIARISGLLVAVWVPAQQILHRNIVWGPRAGIIFIFFYILHVASNTFTQKSWTASATFIFSGHFGGCPQLLLYVLVTLVDSLSYFYILWPLWWTASATFIFRSQGSRPADQHFSILGLCWSVGPCLLLLLQQ